MKKLIVYVCFFAALAAMISYNIIAAWLFRRNSVDTNLQRNIPYFITYDRDSPQVPPELKSDLDQLLRSTAIVTMPLTFIVMIGCIILSV